MNLQRLYEDRFGDFPLSNITYYLIIGQVIAYIISQLNPALGNAMLLRGDMVFSGQWWRLITMLFMPAVMSPIWLILEWYFMYIMGTGLEQIWGAFCYTLFLAIAYMATLVSAILFPTYTFTNVFIYSSLFLAFSYLNPDFTVMVFFIIPLKIKWLAWITWIGIAASFITGVTEVRVAIVLQIANFLVFFGQDIWVTIQDRMSHGSFLAGQKEYVQQTYMQCASCHATELDRKIFYYCHDCHPEQCFCQDHIKDHKHKIVN